MRSFLLPYFVTFVLVVGGSALAMSAHIARPPLAVLYALRKPLVVSLFASGPAAAIPGFIQAMCNELGFRRDLVEFTAPLAPAFLRAGEAVFFAVLAVFVANVYGRDLDLGDLLLICGVSTLAAFVSVNAVSGVRSIAAGSLVLAYLDLPMEALLPAFVLLEVICEGPRNVLSIVLSGALVALASKGLPSEAPAAPPLVAALQQQMRFVLTRGRAMAAVALITFALFASYLAGVGIGMRKSQVLAAPAVPRIQP